jgi:hypothetical protein
VARRIAEVELEARRLRAVPFVAERRGGVADRAAGGIGVADALGRAEVEFQRLRPVGQAGEVQVVETFYAPVPETRS